MRHVVALMALSLLPGLLPADEPAQSQDLIASVNALRAHGCGKQLSPTTSLRSAPLLDAAAVQFAEGAELADAIADAGYDARSATSIHFRLRESDAFEDVLSRRFCSRLMDAAFADIGIAQRADQTWIILAAPFTPPSPNDATKVRAQVIELVNAARASGVRCGRKRFDAAPPLVQSLPLERAALAHTRDLAAQGPLSHRGSDGSGPADRVTRESYIWSAVAENVASGAMTAQEVVAGWLASTSHCENIMNPRFTDTGVAFALAPRERGGIYWAQVFAIPRQPQ